MNWWNNGPSVGGSSRDEEEALFYAKDRAAKDLYWEENRGKPTIKVWDDLPIEEKIPYYIRVSEMNTKTYRK